MAWHSYALPPIDFGWEYMETVQAFAKRIADSDIAIRMEGHRSNYPLDEFLAHWDSAKSEAKKLGWEGDFREQPRVFSIPAETEFQHGFVIKQDNNGSTFVVSPVPLPHLKDLAF